MTRTSLHPQPRAVRFIARAGLAALLLATPVAAQDAAAPDSTVRARVDSLFAAAPDSGAPAPAATPTAADANPRLKYDAHKVRLSEKANNVIRSGPGDGYAVVGVYPKKSVFTVIAKRGDWFGVQLSPTQTGWVHRSLCEEFDDMSDLEFKPNPKMYTRTGTFILTGYSGAYAFDRKSNSLVAGGRLGYYVFDRLQAEGGAAWTHIRRPAEIVESLFDLSLEAEDFHMLFYHLGLTFEILPGRQMVPFVTGGVGSTIMRGESEPAYHYGAGTTLYLSRKTAVRWEVRNYHFQSGPDDARSTNDNVEFTLGTSVLF